MAAQQRPLSPHLQIYKWQITMSLSIVHRATGVFIAFGAFALVFWLSAIAGDAGDYQQFQALASSIPGKLLLVTMLGSFLYHLLNGIRHLLWDVGWGLDLVRVYATGWTVVALSLAGTAALAWLVFGAGAAA
ncbi:MAG: succinate dehydrogenase, cytochrome b556 subunit [Arenimonas sp.]